MRELDELLARFIRYDYYASSEQEKSAFRELLTLPDPVLAEYLVTGQATADGVSALVISKIRNGARSGESRS
jgi:succinate dehydrogenase flavin-adding protein (antitoxin of CptAB toxin-antitoxin module)